MIWKQIWYENHPLSYLLAPVGWLFCSLSFLRKQAYAMGLLRTNKLPVPVIVIGNISVGGTGKTPLVIWMINFLKEHGYKPGVISRGYGGAAAQWPQQVRSISDPAMVGDEPVLIARKANCPVYVSPNRYEAGLALLKEHDCDMIVCDDGLQHYSLHRDFEICVVDGLRRHGNERCLPAGPLREPVSRLTSVDATVCNGDQLTGEFQMSFEPVEIKQVNGDEIRSFEDFKSEKIHAVAGIGNPDRFFELLRGKGLNLIEHAFSDHHSFTESDLVFTESGQVIMTEKDAVKCKKFAKKNDWFLSIEAQLPEVFEARLINMFKTLKS